MWALLANALAPGHCYTNEDLLWLAGHAGSFIVEGGTISGRSVYRLYHRSLAEDLIAGRDQTADEHAITTTLAAHVPRRFSGRPDWPASHPYIRAHLATHAARRGDIDDLAQDPGFLLAADPPPLLAALDTTTSSPSTRRRRRLPQRPAPDPPPSARRACRLPRAGRPLRTRRSPRRPHRCRRPGRPVARPLGILAAATPPPATYRPHRLGTRGGGGRAGWPPGRRLRRRRRDGAGVGPGHRPPVGDPFTGHTGGVARWRPPSWMAARWSSPAATTGRCGCGTWPPARRSATRSPATTAR